MTSKNFIIKNGLSIGSTEIIQSDGTYVGSISASALDESVDDRVADLLQAGTGISLTYDDAANTLTIDGQQGDITGVTAGSGLAGGGTSGAVTLNVGAGTGITVNADDVAVNMSAFDTGDLSEGSNKYYTDERVDDRVGNLLSAGVNVALSYDDANGDLEIRVPYENIQDTVGAQLVTNGSHTGITASYDDANDAAIDLAVSTSHIRGLVSASGDLSYDSSTGVFSFTNDAGDIESVVAGTGLSGGGTSGAVTLNVDLSELTDMTAAVDGSADELILLDNGADRRKLISEINLSAFNNDSGFTSNNGDITSVAAGDGLSGGGSSGAVTLTVNVDDSSIETDTDALRVKAGGITNAMLAGSIANSKLANSAITVNSNSVSLGGSVTLDTSDFAESGNLFHTTERVQDVTGVQFATNGSHTGISFAYDDAGDGAIDATVSSSFVRGLFSAGGDLSYDSSTGAFSFTNDAGDIEGVTAGDGLSGGGTSGTVSLAVNVDDSSLEISTDTVQVKAGGITNAMLAGSIANGKLANSSISVNSNSVSLGGSVVLDTDDIGEGTNQYHTTERVQDVTGAQIATNGSHTNITASYDDAGDGAIDLSISDATIRGKFSGGTGVSVSSGTISIGQAVSTSSNVQFNNLVVDGNLTVNGTTSTVDSTNTTISDALIELGSGNSGANSNDLGLILERGSTGDNGFIGWDESADRFIVATTTATGSSTGDLTLSEANFRASQMTTSYASNSSGVMRNIYQNTSAPTSSDGAVGDVWITYS